MKVFISYAHSDRALAGKVGEALEHAGMNVWGAERKLPPGDNWGGKIATGLKESVAMVVLLTPDALRSKVVQQEIEYALGEKSFNGRLIPVLVGAPERFSENSVPWILRRLNMISLPDRGLEEEGLERITRALKEVA